MKRRVVQHGPSSLSISLPSQWVKEQGIKKGDTLNVLPSSNSLIVSRKKLRKGEKKHLHIKSIDAASLELYLQSYYRKGYEEIIINIDNQNFVLKDKGVDRPLREVVREKLGQFLGVEIVEESEDKIVIKQLTKDSGDEFESLLRRSVFLLTDSMKTTIEALLANNTAALAENEGNYEGLKKFINYCLRLLNQGVVGNTSDSVALGNLTLLIGIISKQLQELKEEVEFTKEEFPDNAHMYLEEFLGLAALFQKFYLKPSVDLLSDFQGTKTNILVNARIMPHCDGVKGQIDILRAIVGIYEEMFESRIRLTDVV